MFERSWEKKEATEMEMSEWMDDKNGPWQLNRKKKRDTNVFIDFELNLCEW